MIITMESSVSPLPTAPKFITLKEALGAKFVSMLIPDVAMHKIKNKGRWSCIHHNCEHTYIYASKINEVSSSI